MIFDNLPIDLIIFLCYLPTYFDILRIFIMKSFLPLMGPEIKKKRKRLI